MKVNPGGLRVVVVDDHPDTAESLAVYLTINGYDASHATSGKLALELMVDEAPTCVLVDIRMPGMNGVELGSELRRRYGGEVTIIAMTGADSEAREYQNMLAVADHVLTKPVDLDRLKRLLRPDVPVGARP